MIQEMDSQELVTDLRSIKLPARDRNRVLRASHTYGEFGVLPTDEVVWLRALAEKHKAKLEVLWESRNRARQSMGMEKSGMTQAELDEAVLRRRAARKKLDPTDFGF